MSELSPIYAKIALILSIVFLVAGVGASIALGVMWFKYSRNESPSGQQFSNFDKRLKNIEKMLGAINKTLGKK